MGAVMSAKEDIVQIIAMVNAEIDRVELTGNRPTVIDIQRLKQLRAGIAKCDPGRLPDPKVRADAQALLRRMSDFIEPYLAMIGN